MNDKTEIYQLKYLVVPDFLYHDSSLSVLQLKIAAFIYTYNGDKFFFSNPKLAEMFNVHEVSVSRAISGLEKLGYIRVEYKFRNDGGRVRYIVRLNNLAKGVLTKRLKPSSLGLNTHAKGKVISIKDNIYKETEEATPPVVDNNVDNLGTTKNGLTSLKGFLHLPQKESNTQNRIHTPWQEHAIRIAEKLNIKPDAAWFKTFKTYYSKNQVAKLDHAYSLTVDANYQNPKKYFYKAITI